MPAAMHSSGWLAGWLALEGSIAFRSSSLVEHHHHHHQSLALDDDDARLGRFR